MKHFLIFVFVHITSQAVSVFADVNCYTCQNCQLPVAQGTSVSTEAKCKKCQIEFNLGQSGGPTGVNATCDTGGTCQASYVAKAETAKFVACCTTAQCNSLPGVSATVLPHYLAICMGLLASL
ncbi:hypothetical protein CSKR_202248 [Clonorchis sinensis]|uniref:UPAR/Ly6 domain-containing protein n=1 Tax=Clonorchis sinensis TaxID=79923 RepID=A0A8T1LWR8_CLOSI|nr:hypothetical protein CSKR_202248 [Clonorchis sinensis]